MRNNYFQFKQFRVEQGNCAMKVTTDACVLGAWTPVGTETNRVLDIGAGTGLLSLMLAQKAINAKIDAVELNSDAAQQASDNFTTSPFASRLFAHNINIANYAPIHSYDLVICNPPFFNNSLKGPDTSRNIARHTDELTYEVLIDAILHNLAPAGLASVLLPRSESALLEEIINQHAMHIHQSLHIKDNDNAAIKRVVLLFGKEKPAIRRSQLLVIKNSDGSYTDVFKRLLQTYYLHL